MLDQILFIIVVNLILYFPALRFDLAADDAHHWIDIKNGQNKRAFEAMVKDRFRIKSILYWLNKVLYGCGTFGTDWKYAKEFDHLITTILHALACVMIFLGLGHNEISFFTALLYAVNPANTQTSIWLNGRRYLVNIILVMAMLMAGPIGMLLYPLTMVFQINAVFAPILIGWGYAWTIPMLLFVFRKKVIGFYQERLKKIKSDEMRTFRPRRLIVVLKTYGFYLSQAIFPRTILMSYPLLDSEGWGSMPEGNKKAYALDKWFWLGVGWLVLSIVGMALLRGEELRFGVFAFISVLAWCNWICATQVLADRYINMANPFIMYFVAKISFMLPSPWSYCVLAVLMGWYARGVWQTFGMYPDLEIYYEYNNFHYRTNRVIRRHRANWLCMRGDWIGAWEHIKTGLMYHPTDFALLHLAGVCMHNMYNFEAAEHYFELAEKNYYLDAQEECKNKLDEIRKINRAMIPKIVDRQRKEKENNRRVKSGLDKFSEDERWRKFKEEKDACDTKRA